MIAIPDMVVVGTDTGVGKSVVSLLLMQLLFTEGLTPFYLKPFQTGCRSVLDPDSDARFVYSHTPELQSLDPARSVIYCLPNPKAPYFAARDARKSIDLSKVRQIVEQARRICSPLVVEAAGGLLVPVTRQILAVDLIGQLHCRPLLVARAGLGTINHTLLSIEAMRCRKITPMGIVFVDASESPADPDLVAENMDAVEMFTDCRVGGVIPHVQNFRTPPQAAYTALRNIVFGRD